MRTLSAAIAALALALVAGLVAPPAGAAEKHVKFGHSVDGKRLVAVRIGDPDAKRTGLVVGSIHGNETAGHKIVHVLRHRYRHARGVDLWVVTTVNPDGVAADTRKNAHGVDLNRNFSWRCRPMGGVYESGPRPFSERESRLARALILRLHPHLTIWFHQHLDMVWASGGDRRLEKVFARVSGLPYHPMPQLAGSAVSWQNNTLRDTTAFAAELPAGEPGPAALERYVRAVLAAAHSDQ